MKKIIKLSLTILLTLVCTNLTFAKADVSYKKEWNLVNTHLKKSLPKSALKEVDKIYKKAKKEENSDQILKALIHKMIYIQMVEEDTFIKIQTELNNELANSSFPENALLHSILAELYWNYYNTNRYRFLNRTSVVNYNDNDIRTWDLRKLVEKVIFHYTESLKESDKLKKIDTSIYQEMISKGYSSRNTRGSLYDFLGHRAIDFFINSQASLTTPVYKFNLNKSDYFLSDKDFSKLKIESEDKFSFDFYAITLFKELTLYHLKNENKKALVDLNLKRLSYLNRKSSLENRAMLYEDALKKMIEDYPTLKSEIEYNLALLYNQLGDKWQINGSTKYKLHKKMALSLCQNIINNGSGDFAITNAKNLISLIEMRNINLKFEEVNIPNKKFKTLLRYKNIEKIYFKIVKLSNQEYQNLKQNGFYNKEKNYQKKPSYKSFDFSLGKNEDYQEHLTELIFPKLKIGKYVILASDNKDFSEQKGAVAYTDVQISNISYIKRRTNDNLELYLLDRESGEPLSNAKIQLWYQEYNKLFRKYITKKGKLYSSDKNGSLLLEHNIKHSDNFTLEFINGDDKLFAKNNFYLYHHGKQYKKDTKTYFFTDRAIYRPGQTVYFKGIMLNLDYENPENNTILTNYQTNVSLFDVNGELVSGKSFKTDEFGAFNGSFQIPLGLLNGKMRITGYYGTRYISVEEYKRPKFEVKFKEQNDSYQLNENIKVEGFAKAYSGFAINDAIVKYRVVRESFFPYRNYWWTPPANSTMEIKNGTTTTDKNGSFEVEFRAIPDLDIDKNSFPAFNYTIYADVTDINGESRFSSKVLTVGYKAMKLNISTSESIDRDNDNFSFNITALNLSNLPLKAEGYIKIYQLDDGNHPIKKRVWETPDKFFITKEKFKKELKKEVYKREDNSHFWKKEKIVFENSFNTDITSTIKIDSVKKWSTGKYLIEASSLDKNGEIIKSSREFTLFSSTSKKPPYSTITYTELPKSVFEVGESAKFIIASSEKIKGLFEIEHRGKIIKSKFIELNNEQKIIDIPIKEEYRGNIAISFITIKDNRVYNSTQNITVPWSNKKLKISFETFRDILKPGENEEWRIKIEGMNGDVSQMLATLYDASLDAIIPHNWSFNPFNSFYKRLNWNHFDHFSINNSHLRGNTYDARHYMNKYYDKLNLFGFYWNEYNYRHRMVKSRSLKKKSLSMDKEMKMEVMDEVSSQSVVPTATLGFAGEAEEKGNAKADISNPTKKKPLKIRTNLNETAFFYPDLKSDKDGNIILAFKIPEAITKWKMLGFAHNKNLKYGLTSRELVTKKELMVIPNTPRFLREGDKIEFSSKITNLSDNEVSGEVELLLFDASTMKRVDKEFSNHSLIKKFKTPKGESSLVSWNLTIPENIDALTYQIVAKSKNHSDGLESTLPILTNRMLVTESLPMPLREKKSKSFKFKKLIKSDKSSSIKHHKLTLEFTSNPVWYVVQAIPYMMEYPYECMEQTFSRYYANSIAHHVVTSKPEIKRVFDIWKSKNSSALISNLEKNQELKSLILEETPWVAEAKNESERKKRIALLFDYNRMSDELNRAINKLADGQMSSGAWPWFNGMHENRYITQHIITGFAHLKALGITDDTNKNKIDNMSREAIIYLDEEIEKDYKWLIKHNVKLNQNNLNYRQIHYLYARSYYRDLPIRKNSQKAYNYYNNLAKKYWTDFNIYSQAMIALSMNRSDNKKTALDILKSIKEHSLYKEEMGMYWKLRRGYYWYQSPIETQAILIELFNELSESEKSINDMKVWLLKQKQTQDWKTTKATAEAVYALLLNGSNWLEENEMVEISIGGEKLNIKDNKDISVEAGTGYFKTSWSGNEIKSEMGNIKVKNPNSVPVWGAIYWQYFEDLDKITPHKTPLSLKKELFIERESSTGKILIPLKKEQLKIGDRVKVRIELRVDRAMDYVHMKDMRASAFEPENVISRYKWQDGLGYYETTKDASTNFFFDHLPKGVYVFEYPLRATHGGEFSNGITTIQSMYAPEFTSHSEGVRVKID